MALPMARPWKNPATGVYYLRSRVPTQIAESIAGRELRIEFSGVVVTIRPQEFFKFSLRTKDPAEAKLRHNDATAALAMAIGQIGAPPVSLPLRQVVALAGEAYRSLMTAFEDDPGEQLKWVKTLHADKDAALGEFGTGQLLIGREAKIAASLEERFGPLADALLNSKSLNVTPETRRRLLQHLARILIEAADRLAGAAGGDYSPDAFKNTLPEWVKPDAVAPTGLLTFEAMFDRYVKTESTFQRRVRTIATYRKIVTEEFPAFLKSHAGHTEPAKVTRADVVAWKEALTDRGLKAKTIKGKKMAALGATFQSSVDAQVLPLNPVAALNIKVSRERKGRPKGFTDQEVLMILRACRDFVPTSNHHPEMVAAIRWLPWLGAYVGARIVELAQLRGEDVQQTPEGPIFRLTPDAGEIKTDEYRDVPIHSHLVEMGFLDFVKASGKGPLFYRQPKGQAISHAKAVSVASRLGGWVRKGAGVDDARVAPNYGWRDRFKTESRRHAMGSEAAEFIMGHSLKGMAAIYGDMAGLRREIDKLPRISLDEGE
ncbi:XerC Integrase [Rhabdaerophilaceae bacterium]